MAKQVRIVNNLGAKSAASNKIRQTLLNCYIGKSVSAKKRKEISSKMSKRPCPFEDNNAPQSKVHVSDADVNSQNEEYMQQLQQQTIRRLFEASNRPSTSANQPSDGVQPSTSGGSSSEQQQKEPSDTEMETDSPRVEPCLLCAQIAVGMCWFCEAKLCGDCTRTCIYCMEQFCTRCSIGVYTNGTTHTCLTCYN